MSIRSIRIQECRIISHAEISPSQNFNLIEGANGSGKSSFLEAISLLATGRSFRTASIPSIVQKGQGSLIVSALIEHVAGHTIPVGIERGKESNRLHINHASARRLSEVAELLPVQVITPDSINLVVGAPRGRRSFLDWGMFHVEPQSLRLIKRYNKTLRQRNALLKKKTGSVSEMQFWNQELVESGERITEEREQYLEGLVEHYYEVVSKKLSLLSVLNIEFNYRKGWKSGLTLAEALEQTAGREVLVGHTVVGPHEADLLITSGEGGAKNILSRGQSKLLSIGLYLAQLSHLYQKTGKRAVVLVDDLFSELDRNTGLVVVDYLISSGHQVFATTTEAQQSLLSGREIEMFHVEHGRVSKGR